MIEPIAGSFRDPDSQVFSAGDRILRGLSDEAHAGLRAAEAAGLDRFLVIDYETADPPDGWPHGVATQRLPFVSAPQEWSFGMLKEAALLTLDLTDLAAANDFTIVDAPADNVTFRGTEPAFIDLGSFRPEPMQHWAAYGQFCDHFLAPLMLEAYRGVPFQPYIGDRGFSILDLGRLLRSSDLRRKGVLSHVKLRSALEQRAQRMSTESRRSLQTEAQPGRAGVQRMLRNLRDLIESLESTAPTGWAGYESDARYTEDAWTRKEQFMRTAIQRTQRSGWAYDVGANAGRFTRILAEAFPAVLAIEQDPGALDALITATRPSSVVHPVVVDITSPTPDRGLMLRERRSLTERAPAEFASFLAVVHHLSIGAGIPLPKVVELMRWIAPEVVVEFVEPADARVEHISASRPLAARGYTTEAFEAAFATIFTTVASERLSDTRVLYHGIAE